MRFSCPKYKEKLVFVIFHFERLGDESFMVTRYTNLLLLYLLYVDFITLPTVVSFFSGLSQS